jgi:hypothetical protein
VPRDGRRRPVRSTVVGAPQQVCELINPTTASWDQQKLHTYFVPVDIETILNIPICSHRQVDFWAWHHEKMGVYSVRSAYRMLVINKERATTYMENMAGRGLI